MSRSKLTPAVFVDIIRKTATAFGEDRIYRHSAALAYFTVFSLSPLIVVLISVLALYFGGDAGKANDAIKHQIEQTVGTAAAQGIQEMVKSATDNGTNSARPIAATVVALVIALWGASGLFGALQDSLNAIWGVMPKPDLGIMGFIRTRFISFAMVLGVGFLLLVSLVLSTVLAAVSGAASGVVGDSVLVAGLLNFGLGLFVSMLLFAAIYKVLPDAKLKWKDVWVGAFVTALLFSLGRLALGEYLGRAGAASSYGSAGALVVLLLWVNYASTILFAGAEFTKAYANTLGSKIRPSDYALAFTTETIVTSHVGKSGPAQATPESLAKGKAALTKDGKTVPTKPPLSPEKQAALIKARRQDFEHSLSVLAGAAMVVLWVLRKRARQANDAE
ncbi:YihY/virulence factor BrkB family protein [bacterium]|nr:MAG: YihY/virulence factor BrkB family protein [bacterium]